VKARKQSVTSILCKLAAISDSAPAMHWFLKPVRATKPPKNGAISGAEVPGLVPYSFPRIVTVFPIVALLEPGNRAAESEQKQGP